MTDFEKVLNMVPSDQLRQAIDKAVIAGHSYTSKGGLRGLGLSDMTKEPITEVANELAIIYNLSQDTMQTIIRRLTP